MFAKSKTFRKWEENLKSGDPHQKLFYEKLRNLSIQTQRILEI